MVCLSSPEPRSKAAILAGEIQPFTNKAHSVGQRRIYARLAIEADAYSIARDPVRTAFSRLTKFRGYRWNIFSN